MSASDPSSVVVDAIAEPADSADTTGQQNRIVLLLLLIVFAISLVGWIGIILDIPRLYTWNTSGTAMSLNGAYSTMALTIGIALCMWGRRRGKPSLIWIARLCFLGVLGYGATELIAHITAPSGLSVEEFLSPKSPILGHSPIYSVIGYLLAGGISLYATMPFMEKPGTQWLVQGVGIFLMSLGLMELFEQIVHPGFFHYLSSIPVSVCFLFYGAALLFLPGKEQYLAAPFLGSPIIRVYTWALMLFWVALIGWQALWGNLVLGTPYPQFSQVYFRMALNQVVGTFMFSLILGLGLHILYSLTEREKLAQSLRDASARLRESLDSLALLGSTLSHDLKAPIVTQMNALEMLSSGHYGKDISSPLNQEVLSAIIDNNQFELDLVMNLINLLRYKIQSQQFQPKEVNLSNLLGEVQKELMPLAVRKQQALTINTEVGAEQTLTADPLGLKRILHNLINNAIMHMKPGHHIWVTTESREHEILFSVKDDGQGISKEKQVNLFNQFNRMSSSGLGLYICKQIVERHGGKIWLESEVNEGTCFYFTIPIHQPRPVETPPAKAKILSASTPMAGKTSRPAL